MSRTQSYDPALAAIRMASRAVTDQRAYHEIDSARFNLFAALQGSDYESARKWLRVLRIATRAIPDWAGPEVDAALADIGRSMPA
jgi:hypothetical protein